MTDDVIYDDVNSEVYTDAAMTKKGFLASYYKNQKLSGTPDSTHVDDKIAFDWGYDSIGPGFPKDHFSARWSFYYKSKEDGLLRISMGGDDGYRIFVNDKLLTGDWGNHVIMFIVVLFPAPFGPKKPTTSPSFTVKLISSTATKPPYFFVTFFTSITCLSSNLLFP